MGFFRRALVVPIALSALALVSSPASAQISTQLSIGQPRLGPLGASVSVPLNFRCDPSLNVAFGDVTVSQVSGHKLATGTGFFVNDFPGVPCTGASQTVIVQVNSVGGFAFKKGKHAIASADLTLFNPVSGALPTTSIIDRPVTIIR